MSVCVCVCNGIWKGACLHVHEFVYVKGYLCVCVFVCVPVIVCVMVYWRG